MTIEDGIVLDVPAAGEVPVEIPSPARKVILLDPESIPELPAGFVLNDPTMGRQYTIQGKLKQGGEAHSYLALEGDQRKTVKFVPVGLSSVHDLEDKLRGEYARLEQALTRNHHLFAASHSHLAIISDFIEGQNLEEELTTRGRAYTQGEVIDFLLDAVERQVKPLHDRGLVHRDLKPANIICAHTEDGSSTYSVIDFGTLREHDALATITINQRGTRGYSRFKGKYECHDDFYSLARVAYFLMTGNHPEFIAHEKYDRMHDEEVFNAMPLDKEFRAVLFRLLGHDAHNRYDSTDPLIKDLRKVQKRVSEEDNIGIDLGSIQKLTAFREASVVPLDLVQRTKGLQERFKEQYEKTRRDRNPLDEGFQTDLESSLLDLGYTRFEAVESKEKGYLRRRKDSERIDVFVPQTSGKTYFRYFQVDSLDQMDQRLAPASAASPKWYSAGRVAGFVLYPAVATLGFLIPTPVGGIALMVMSAYTLFSSIGFYINDGYYRPVYKKYDHDSTYTSCAWAPQHVTGKLFYDLARGSKKLSQGIKKASEGTDKYSLQRALEPAPHFRYKTTA